MPRAPSFKASDPIKKRLYDAPIRFQTVDYPCSGETVGRQLLSTRFQGFIADGSNTCRLTFKLKSKKRNG